MVVETGSVVELVEVEVSGVELALLVAVVLAVVVGVEVPSKLGKNLRMGEVTGLVVETTGTGMTKGVLTTLRESR